MTVGLLERRASPTQRTLALSVSDMPGKTSGSRTSPSGSAPNEAPEDLLALAGRLNMAIKACAAYPPGHPSAAALVRLAYGATTEALHSHGSLLFALAKGQLLANGQPFRRRELAPQRLARSLDERDIRAVTIEPTPALEDFGRLVEVLGRPVPQLASEGGAQKALGAPSCIALALVQYDQALSVPAAGERTWQDDELAAAVAKYMAGAGAGLPDPGLLALLELLKRPQEVQYAIREDAAADPGSAEALATAIRRLLVAILTQVESGQVEALAARLAAQDERFRPLAEMRGGVSASDVIEATEGLSAEALTTALAAVMDMGVLSRENLAGALAEAMDEGSMRAVAPGSASAGEDGRRGTSGQAANLTAAAEAHSEHFAALLGDQQERRSHAKLLTDLLAAERDRDTVAALVGALEDLAFGALEAGDGEVLLWIVQALGARSSENEEPAVLLEVQNARRRLAAEGSVLAVLARMGGAAEEGVREAFAQALLELGELALDACQGALTDPDGPRYAVEAAHVLVRGGPAGWARVAEVLQEAQPRGREECVEALGRFGDPAAAPTLAIALKDPVRSIRQRAALLLGHLGSPEVIPDLAAVARQVGWLDRDYVLREEAVRALGHLDSPEAARELARTAEVGSTLMRRRARRVADAAVYALAHMQTPAAVDCLAELRQSKSRTARAAAQRCSQDVGTDGHRGGRAMSISQGARTR